MKQGKEMVGERLEWTEAAASNGFRHLQGTSGSGMGVGGIDAKVSILGYASSELNIVLGDSDSPNTRLTIGCLAWSQKLPMYHCVSCFRNPVRRHR